MESTQITESKKQTIGMVHAQELASKFKSKQDFIVYLDQHRKSLLQIHLTPLQYSFTCRTRPS